MRPECELKVYGIYRNNKMATPDKKTYRAYVTGETDTHYTVVSEFDKRFHQIEKAPDGYMPANPIQLDPAVPDHSVIVQTPYFTDPSRLFTACREYCYDKVKNSKASARKRQVKREEKQKAKQERLAKGVMMYGKHKNATYEDIMVQDMSYCDWILKQEDKNDEIKKFKEYLHSNYQKFKDALE